MKILDMPRASGKTRTLVEWAKQASWTRGKVPTRFILVPNRGSVEYVRSISGGEASAITIGELPKLRGLENVELAIDELDEVISMLIGYPVVVATRTGK